MWIPKRLAPCLALASAAGLLALAFGCGRPGLFAPYELWIDDEGREIAVVVEEEWVGTWVREQRCPVEGSRRPTERFRLRVEGGRGVGTIGICRYGYDDCTNGPVTARYEAIVTTHRIEGTVVDRQCHGYAGSEVLQRVRCPRRPVTDYLSSSMPLRWEEDYSRLDVAGLVTYRAFGVNESTELWALSSIRGVVVRAPPDLVEVEAGDGAVQWHLSPPGEALVNEGGEVFPGSRLARFGARPPSDDVAVELNRYGFTPDTRPTDPHCIDGEARGPVLIHGPVGTTAAAKTPGRIPCRVRPVTRSRDRRPPSAWRCGPTAHRRRWPGCSRSCR